MTDPEPTPRRFTTQVRVRWSDMDAFGHLNHARALTLLEEARLDWLYDAANRERAAGIADAVVVAELDARYLRPIRFSDQVSVSMGVQAMTAGSATIDYRLLVGELLVLTAHTRLVPVDPITFRARRWTAGERSFLAEFGGG